MNDSLLEKWGKQRTYYRTHSLLTQVLKWMMNIVPYGTLKYQNWQVVLDVVFTHYLNNERKIDSYVLIKIVSLLTLQKDHLADRCCTEGLKQSVCSCSEAHLEVPHHSPPLASLLVLPGNFMKYRGAGGCEPDKSKDQLKTIWPGGGKPFS